MKILYWNIDSELKKEIEENYRTNYAIGLKDREPLDIIHRLTFDGVAPNMTIKKIEKLFDFVENNFLDKKIAGVGIEVGGGPATFSSILAKRKLVDKIYNVEVCQPIVELLAPKVAQFILNDYESKVIGAIGSFNNMELPDNSVDFIFDFFSLHHSDNLERTLKECHRILKKDGYVLCFDKARPDNYTREDLDELLDKEYEEAHKINFGLPANQKFTRRMNGEKEYRLKDWNTAFNNSGFMKIKHFYLAKIIGGSFTSYAVKNFLSLFPSSFQVHINKFLPPPKFNHKFILSSKNRIFSKLVNPFAKEISLMIAYK